VSSSPQNDAMTDVVDADDSDTQVSLSDDDCADDVEDADAAMLGLPLPNKEGLSMMEVISLLTADADHLPGPILASIPHGEKNN